MSVRCSLSRLSRWKDYETRDARIVDPVGRIAWHLGTGQSWNTGASEASMRVKKKKKKKS